MINHTSPQSIEDLINRYKDRIKKCFKNPNPYYRAGERPSEYMDIELKIKELTRLTKNN